MPDPTTAPPAESPAASPKPAVPVAAPETPSAPSPPPAATPEPAAGGSPQAPPLKMDTIITRADGSEVTVKALIKAYDERPDEATLKELEVIKKVRDGDPAAFLSAVGHPSATTPEVKPEDPVTLTRAQWQALQERLGAVEAVTTPIGGLRQEAEVKQTIEQYKGELPHLVVHPQATEMVQGRVDHFRKLAEAKGMDPAKDETQRNIWIAALQACENDCAAVAGAYKGFEAPKKPPAASPAPAASGPPQAERPTKLRNIGGHLVDEATGTIYADDGNGALVPVSSTIPDPSTPGGAPPATPDASGPMTRSQLDAQIKQKMEAMTANE